MKRYLLPAFTLMLTLLSVWWFFNNNETKLSRKATSIKSAFEENYRRTLDPALGYPPTERMIAALEKTRRMQAEWAERNSRSPLSEVRWRERGPDNIGGRTRAVLIDKNDPTRKTLWVGSVAGGLWKTNDITADPPNWQKINDYMENLSIGAIAQDPANPQIMYVGTGEGFPNLDAVRGLGIFRSTDGGQNWSVLPNTLNNNFRYTQDMLVHPVSGHVYAATSAGMMRSTNGGESWQKVHSASDFYDVQYAANSGFVYASNSGNVYRTTTGNLNEWTRLTTATSGFIQGGIQRVEMALSPSNNDVLYAICSEGGGASDVYFSSNGGLNWVKRGFPSIGGGEFTNGQAWYDLDIAVDPYNPQNAIAGGVPLMRSTDGGFSWVTFTEGTHVDQHTIIFDEQQQNVVYFGNDGGIHRSVTGVNGQAINKNKGYNVTQFYACAIHPTAYTNYFLGGTQDNNSLQIQGPGIKSARSVWGGDGFYCHIDENEPNIQIVSSQFANYGLSTNGGATFDNGASLNGGFINPSDYDSDANIMYAQTNDGDFYRWKINTGQQELVDIQGVNLDISAVTVDRQTPNRVYFGTYNGSIYRVDNAHTGATVSGTALATLPGTVSSVEMQEGNPNHLIATVSNYGVASVHESTNGGQSWINVEGNLPDMPVRWGIFNPNNPQQAMIATEAGVWVTELLNGTSTEWVPPVPGRGTPLVRTDMLRLRRSDKVVLAATHGRGLFTTEVFADPAARMEVSKVQYINAGNVFGGDASYNADSYFWEFGDGATSTEEAPTHNYAAIGQYPVKLTINGNLSTNSNIRVLPDMPLPYIAGRANYGGDFEGFTEQYATETISGSSFERGNSTVPGKNGAKSGENAFVLGLNETFYQPNTHAILYMPNYDLSEQGIYEFSFWAKYDMQPALDGFLVEYSTDRGKTWQTLGSNADKNWYNYRNNNSDDAAFEPGTSYFTDLANSYTRFRLNISGLSGNEVAFRFVFRSEGTGNFRGVAIDDVQVNKYEGELVTQLTAFSGERTSSTEVKLTWSTLPEYYCRKFEVERSVNGRDFENIGNVNATGFLTANVQSYSHTSVALLDLYFYRIKVINEQSSLNYYHEFYSPIIAVRRDLEGVEVRRIFPNPFTDQINLTLTDVYNAPVSYELFSVSGQLVAKGSVTPATSPLVSIPTPSLVTGVYMLRVTIGDTEPKVFQLLHKG